MRNRRRLSKRSASGHDHGSVHGYPTRFILTLLHLCEFHTLHAGHLN
jgi:hypothetical protein